MTPFDGFGAYFEDPALVTPDSPEPEWLEVPDSLTPLRSPNDLQK